VSFFEDYKSFHSLEKKEKNIKNNGDSDTIEKDLEKWNKSFISIFKDNSCRR
jgi:hypothetical protein